MPGFPLLPTRSTFGPTLEEWGKVTNPKREIGQATFNLAWWQIAALSQLVGISWIEVSAAGARIASAEGWNPNGLIGLTPAPARTSTGLFTVTYQGTYADEPTAKNPAGVQRPFAPKRPRATALGVSGGTDRDILAVASVSGLVVTVKVTVASTNVLVDAPFLLEVWP